MRVPLLLVLVSLVGVAVGLSVPGWADLALLAGLCALAGLILFGAALLRLEPRAAADPKWVIVDGSN
ncbi:MAG: hypothetical protein ACOVME_02260, partial [Rhodobacter sp.]